MKDLKEMEHFLYILSPLKLVKVCRGKKKVKFEKNFAIFHSNK